MCFSPNRTNSQRMSPAGPKVMAWSDLTSSEWAVCGQAMAIPCPQVASDKHWSRTQPAAPPAHPASTGSVSFFIFKRAGGEEKKQKKIPIKEMLIGVANQKDS